MTRLIPPQTPRNRKFSFPHPDLSDRNLPRLSCGRTDNADRFAQKVTASQLQKSVADHRHFAVH